MKNRFQILVFLLTITNLTGCKNVASSKFVELKERITSKNPSHSSKKLTIESREILEEKGSDNRGYSYPRWPASWDAIVANHIRGLKLFDLHGSKTLGTCPKLHTLNPREKTQFFQAFFMGLASAESGYSKHSTPKSGVMQLTCDSNARVHYHCPCKNNTNLRDDIGLNIRCAMNIIDYQWRKNEPIMSGNRYFQTLRSNHHRTKIINAIKSRRPANCT